MSDHQIILAADTALGACSVAVLDGNEILAHHFEEMARGHAEALAPMVEATMREAGIRFAALDRLAVTTGPGTFTGQRVGLAFMRGLKVALKKPLVGITTLEAMAFATGARRAAAIHDAKRDEAYLLLWEKGEAALPPTVMPFAEALARLRAFGACTLCGTGAQAAKAALGEDFSLSEIRQPDALWVAKLAMTRPAPDLPPAPLYLRAPDAKLPGAKLPDAKLSYVKLSGAKPPARQFDPQTDDIATLAALHAASFAGARGADAWSGDFIRDLLSGPGVFAYVEASGFILARAAGGEAEILTLAVAPAMRRHGIGRALVQAAAIHAQDLGAGTLFLEVAKDNEAARKLYSGLGFMPVGLRKAYYGGEDALVLKAALPLANLALANPALPNPGKFA